MSEMRFRLKSRVPGSRLNKGLRTALKSLERMVLKHLTRLREEERASELDP